MQPRRPIIQDIYYPRRTYKKVYTYRPIATYAESPQQPAAPAIVKPVNTPVKRAKWPALLVVAALLVLGFLVKSALTSSDLKNGHVLLAAANPKPTQAVTKPVNTEAISQQINAIIAKYPGLQISVSYVDLKTSTEAHLGVSEPYLAASTAKLLTASLYLHQVEEGKHSLSEKVGAGTAQAQMKLLIENSDNTAWANFNQILGSKALNQYAVSIGLTHYSFNRNTTTSSDIATLLEKLYDNQLLNSANTQLLLSFMHNASETQYIPDAIPQNMKVYHKAGYLSDRAHDAAIVDDGSRPFVLVIFTKSNSSGYDFVLGKNIMHEITGVVLEQVKQAE